MQVSASRYIEASPDDVWALVSDVTQIGRFSPETFEAEWLDGATEPSLGVRFRGHVRRNEVGPTYWSTCEVSAFEDGRVFGFDTILGDRRLSHWEYEVTPEGDGTLLTESMYLHDAPGFGLYSATVGRRRARFNERNIATTLARIAAALEGTEPPPPTTRGIERTMKVADQVEVPASPAAVWELLADPRRTPEFSPENVSADTPHAGPLSVGERFTGRNERGKVRWTTTCEVVASDPGERFAFTVDRYLGLPARVASWEFVIEPTTEGCRVTQTWRDDRRWPDRVADRFDTVATGGRTFAAFQERNIRRSLDNLAALFDG